MRLLPLGDVLRPLELPELNSYPGTAGIADVRSGALRLSHHGKRLVVGQRGNCFEVGRRVKIYEVLKGDGLGSVIS